MKNFVVVCLVAAISAVFVIETAHAASLAQVLAWTTY